MSVKIYQMVRKSHLIQLLDVIWAWALMGSMLPSCGRSRTESMNWIGVIKWFQSTLKSMTVWRQTFSQLLQLYFYSKWKQFRSGKLPQQILIWRRDSKVANFIGKSIIAFLTQLFLKMSTSKSVKMIQIRDLTPLKSFSMNFARITLGNSSWIMSSKLHFKLLEN